MRAASTQDLILKFVRAEAVASGVRPMSDYPVDPTNIATAVAAQSDTTESEVQLAIDQLIVAQMLRSRTISGGMVSLK